MCSENTNGYNFAKKKTPCFFKNSYLHLRREIKLLASNVNRYKEYIPQFVTVHLCIFLASENNKTRNSSPA